MWRRAGGAVACALCWLLACGRSERNPSDSDDGNAGTSSGGLASAGTANASSAGKAGTAATVGGTATVGGMATVGGASTLGGRPASAGNASGGEAEAGMPGAAGEPSAGGAPSCEGTYRACGCGCCGGQFGAIACVYPAAGDDLSAIIAADIARRQSPGCGLAGCSAGLDYVCCEQPPADADQTPYVGSLTIDPNPSEPRKELELWKEDGVCTNFVLVQPSVTPANLPLQTPPGWAPVLARSRHLPCSASSLGPKAIGAIGKLELRVLGDACVLDAHFTLFFGDDVQDIQAERFDIDAMPLNLAVDECR